MFVTLKNGKEILVREVQIEDVQSILDYMELIHRQTKNLTREPEEWKMTFLEEEKFVKRVISSNDEAMLLAFDGDLLVSCSGIHGSGLKRLRHRVSLGISILEDYRGFGLGTRLMNELINEAKKRGKRIVELEVRADNPDAIHVYEKVGFVKDGLKKEGFFVDEKYVDLVSMAKKL